MSEHMICRDENGEPCTQCKEATGWIWDRIQDLALNAHRSLQKVRPCDKFPEELLVEYETVVKEKTLFGISEKVTTQLLPPPPGGMRKATMLMMMSKGAQQASRDIVASELEMERIHRKRKR